MLFSSPPPLPLLPNVKLGLFVSVLVVPKLNPPVTGLLLLLVVSVDDDDGVEPTNENPPPPPLPLLPPNLKPLSAVALVVEPKLVPNLIAP